MVLECGAMDKNDGNGSALELITSQRVELGLREPRNVSMERALKVKPSQPTRVQGLTC